VFKIKWMVVLVFLVIVLILTQDRWKAWDNHTIGTEIVLDTPDGTPR
jgi:hypothetical protein